MSLSNKTIVITGVSSGIGAEICRAARLQGAHVIGVDRNDPALSMDAFHQADLGDPAAIDALVASLPDGIDALCNVAGVPGTAPQDVVERVNYLGLRHLTHTVLPKMTAGGSIVNISSILGAEWLKANPVPQETCYQYFKEALIVWSATKAQSVFNEYDVRMNTVAPGPVMTPILGDFIQMLGEDRVEADAHRMKRPALADEVGDVVAFMCSDASRWIVGANIPVDGGLAATYI